MPNIVIIGASVAGSTSALKLREKIPDASITLLTQEAYPCYDRRRLPELLAGTIKENELFLASEELYARNNITFLKEKKVSSLNPSRRTIYFKEKGTLEYDFLLIASGRRFTLPEIPGAKRKGVFTLEGLEDYKKFIEHIRIIRSPVCIAGSNAWAFTIGKVIASNYKLEVKLLSANPPGEGELSEGFEVINSPITEIIGEGEVQAVKLKEGKAIGVSSVVFLDEQKSNVDFLKNTELKMEQECIATDEAMRTSIENIFACGTVARRKGQVEPSKNWDEVIIEAENFAENFAKQMKGETCQTY
ncbi:MAG TPA: FAD-dependent oxidoreductase [Candidatus Margulisiibacteriota bacterium]|nr:FAD-dependent oxidoreductase [Candidatus Margulisiibacteriota bacterium]